MLPAAVFGCCKGGIGAAPGCGGAGPSCLSPCSCVVRVGVGWGCAKGVGAGTAAAPGCGGGYAFVGGATAVVVVGGGLFWLAGGRCVCGVAP